MACRYRFDDEHVTKEDMRKVLEELYGGEEEIIPGIINVPFKLTRNSNAYMLVYVRESDLDKIICSIDEKDIAEHLRERSKTEQGKKEQQKKEKEDPHLYTIVKVARDEDFDDQIGINVFFDLVDHDKLKGFCVLKSMPFSVLKEEVAKEFGVPVHLQRFWHWAKRENCTYRPTQPLTHLEETKTIEQVMEVPCEVKLAELKLFLEVELGPNEKPIPLPNRTEDDILLFFKVYYPETEDLRYAGRLYVKGIGTPADILTELNKMAGYAPDEEIILYKEIKFEPTVVCECINMKFTFKSSQLVDGDIVCFQKSLSVETSQLIDYPDVPTYLEYRHNLQVVYFRSLEKPKGEEFNLLLSRLDTYDKVVERVAHRLGVDDPSKIRLTSQDLYTQLPKPYPIEYRGVDNLLGMLLYYNCILDLLYYEILDMPQSGLQGLTTLEIAFCHAVNNDMDIISLRLPKESTVGDLLHDLKTMVKLSHPNAELRLIEVFRHKIKIFAANESIESLNYNRGALRAEEICEEVKSLGPLDCMIHVYHFQAVEIEKQMQIQNFGVPFLLVIHANEVLSHIKIRVQKKLNVPDDEFSKWKFAIVSEGRAEYLQDSDILFSCFQNSDIVYCERYLGLEHLSLVKNQMEEGSNSENHLTSAEAFVEGGIQEASDDSCSICLEDFCDSDPAAVTSCKHEFHLHCILEWCQRSSECPMCLQPISLKDPSNQELLDAVEHERKLLATRPRNTSIFHHPTLGDFELQHLPISASESELEEQIIQHLAASAAMGRARQLARIEGRRSRSSAQGHPHFLVFSAHPNGPSATLVTSSANERDGSDGSSTLPIVRIAASNSSLFTIGEDSTQLIPRPLSNQGSIVGANQHGISSTNWRSPTQTSPSSRERAGSSDFQSFSESLKSRVSAWSMKYKESLTRSTRGWKEKLFTRNSSASCPSIEVLREVDHGIVPASRLMDHLEIREEDRTNVASMSIGTVDSSSGNPTAQRIIETSAGLSVNDHRTQAPCAASSASN